MAASARVLKLALLTLLGLALAAILALGAMALWYWPQLPTLERVTDYQPRQPLQVFTQDGVEIAQFGAERRQFVAINKVPRTFQDALLAIEDTGFREHIGISVRGLARAVVANLSGGMAQGASTITQQVARTFFLSTRRTAERKIKEALLSFQIEQQLSKDQILELYINQIYLGQRSYGFAAAAVTYFGKPLDALSVAETALLAGLPQNPIYANPITSAERAIKRQRIVLRRMLVVGVINEAQYVEALAEELVFRRAVEVDVHAEYVAEMARQAVVERFGERAYVEGFRVVTSLRAADQRAAHTALRRALMSHERKQPYDGPEGLEALPADAAKLERAAALALKDYKDDDELRVAIVTQATPVLVKAQLAHGESISIAGDGLRWAQAALSAKANADLAITRGAVIRVMQDAGGAGGSSANSSASSTPNLNKARTWSIVQWPKADGALVVMDPATGRVRALVGGFSFTAQPFNHVTNAWRQPGSSFKPFLYSAAIEQGLMPDTVFDDSPLTNEAGGPPKWNPKNSDGRYDGPITMREAMTRSKNMVSIRLLKQVGLGTAREWIAHFGFDMNKQPDNLTLALGAGSTTPLQLAGAYAVLANGGHRVSSVVVERITDARGQLLFEASAAEPLSEANRVMPQRNVYLVNSMLNDVTRAGTAARAQATLQRTDLYGKTGTTNDAVDAWFAGFQPTAVAVAWVGHDKPQSLGMGESGGGLALPAWIDTMAQVLRKVPVVAAVVPEGITAVVNDWRYSELVLAPAGEPVAPPGAGTDLGAKIRP